MNDNKALIWFIGLILLNFFLYMGKPDIHDALIQMILSIGK